MEIITDERILRQISTKVDVLDKKLISKMKEVMKKENAVGLAAVQVGVLQQIILVEDMVLINPVLITKVGVNKIIDIEGCASIPNVQVEVSRDEEIIVEYLNADMRLKVCEFKGLTARIIQHEIDHLNGILITDKTINRKM